jgi:hypothetical protein
MGRECRRNFLHSSLEATGIGLARRPAPHAAELTSAVALQFKIFCVGEHRFLEATLLRVELSAVIPETYAGRYARLKVHPSQLPR